MYDQSARYKNKALRYFYHQSKTQIMFSSFKHSYKLDYLISLLAITLLCLLVQPAHSAISHDQSLNWKTLSSKHFEIHFHNGEKDLAEKTARIAEYLLVELQESLQWQVSDTIEIIISDEQDIANGFVYPLLTHLRMTIFPTAANEYFDYNNWLELLIRHELTHVLHLDKSKGNPESFKKVLGRHPLLYPNLFQPLWLIEGYATYQETNEKKGTGRGQSSIYHMMMRTEVENGIKPLNQVNLNIASWPVGITRYLYGYYFYEFLDAKYGKQSITDFIDSYSDNLIPYRLNHNTRQVYGKTFHELWSEFSNYLSNKFQKEIDQINTQKVVNGEQVTSTGYLKLYAQPLENGDLLYAEYDAVNPPHLLLKKPNVDKTEFISEIHAEARLDSHLESGVLISQIEIYRNTNAFYDLFHIDLKEKDLNRLTRGDRFRYAVWNPAGDKILAIYNKLGRHSMVLLNNEGRLIDHLWEGESGEYISGIDWSPNNETIIASVKRNHGSWNLEEFNIAQRTWKTITLNTHIEVQPQYSPDGKFILYSADYEGVFNIHKLYLTDGKIETLTHVMGGAFSPRLNNKGDIFYIGYTAKGYDVFQLKNKTALKTKPIIAQSKQLTESYDQYPSTNYSITDYSSSSHIKPSWWTPAFSGDENAILLGAYTSGSDALNRHAYDAYLGFDFKSTSFSGEFNYSYDRWFPLLQTHLETVNRETYRTDTYQVEMLAPLFSRDDRIYLGINATYEKNRNTITEANSNKVTTTHIDPLIGIGAIYDSRRQQIKSISPSFGRLVSLTTETSDVFGGNANGQMLIGKWKEYINIHPQHVVALRFIGGFGLKSARPFQLGGSIGDSEFQGTSMLSTLPLRASLYNKRRYALRGYPSDAASLVGRRMVLLNAEWRMPLKQIERSLNMFPLGLHQLSATIFAERGSVWTSGTDPENYRHSAGLELHFHTEWFYFIPLQARLGYAYGFNEDGDHQGYFAFGSSF